MKRLVESQFGENQVSENELEKLYGGSGDDEGCCRGLFADCTRRTLSDEENESIIF